MTWPRGPLPTARSGPSRVVHSHMLQVRVPDPLQMAHGSDALLQHPSELLQAGEQRRQLGHLYDRDFGIRLLEGRLQALNLAIMSLP